MMFEFPWHNHLATVSLILGGAMVAWSLSWGVSKVLREHSDPIRALVLMRCLRIGLIGLSLVGIGSGFLWESKSLLVLSFIFGCEELYETSVVIAVLKKALHNA
jgi:hypothetical protein